MFGAKEFGKHIGFPTPTATPTEMTCLTLRLPADSGWWGVYTGLLSILADESSWQQFEGGIPTEDAAHCAAEIYQAAIGDAATVDGCETCSLGSGAPFMRVNPATGQVEQYDGANWLDPYGDYTLPPTPARPDVSGQDPICLAAANASYCLQLLYENLTESFSAGLEIAEAITALTGQIAALFGATGYGLAAAALIEIGGLIFQVCYQVVAFITADVWSEGFNQIVTNSFFCCGTVDGDNVVHFDWECVTEALAANFSVAGLTSEEIRLYGQLYYLLSWIGNQGLDAAGATTAIDEASCSCGWCWIWDFTEDEQGWGVFSGYGSYSAGNGFESVPVSTAYSLIGVNGQSIAFSCTFIGVTVGYNTPPVSDPASVIQIGTTDGATFTVATTWSPIATPNPNTYTLEGSFSFANALYINPNGGINTVTATVRSILLRGDGDVPAFTSGHAC